MLPGLVGIVPPDAAAAPQLRAELIARDVRNAVLRLAGVRCRAEINEKIARGIDDEGMHRMIAGERQAGDDDLRRADRYGRALRQDIAHDAVVYLGIKCAIVE